MSCNVCKPDKIIQFRGCQLLVQHSAFRGSNLPKWHLKIKQLNIKYFQNVRVKTLCRVASDPDAADAVNWDNDFVIGSVVDASVHEQKEYGLVFDFAAHADVLGLAPKHQVSACVRVCM